MLNFRQAKPTLATSSVFQSDPTAGFDWYFFPVTDAMPAGTVAFALAQSARVTAVEIPAARTAPAMESFSKAVCASLPIWPSELRASAVFALAMYFLTP